MILPQASQFKNHWADNQAPVVWRVDKAIHWINLYPLDSAIHFVYIYPLDSNLSIGLSYLPFEQPCLYYWYWGLLLWFMKWIKRFNCQNSSTESYYTILGKYLHKKLQESVLTVVDDCQILAASFIKEGCSRWCSKSRFSCSKYTWQCSNKIAIQQANIDKTFILFYPLDRDLSSG